jgi:hypothetical protein
MDYRVQGEPNSPPSIIEVYVTTQVHGVVVYVVNLP